MKRRHKRISFIILGLAGLGIAVALVLSAFQQNLVFFFSPSQVVAKEAPINKTFRVGGLVENGTLKRDNDGLTVRFTVTDTAEHSGRLQRHSSRSFQRGQRLCCAESYWDRRCVLCRSGVGQARRKLHAPEAGQTIGAAKHEKEAAKSVVY